jgi:Flp pilus assembly protein TadD
MTRRLRYLGFKWRVVALLMFGRRGQALRLLRAMQSEFPGDAYALASIAHLQSQDGDTRGALITMEQLLAVQAQDGSHWFNYGFLLEAAERYEQAEAAFRRAVELRPGLDRAWYGLGLVLIRLGRLDEAADALKRNTQLQPMSPFGWYQLARVHVDRREPEEAVRIIRHLRNFEPKVAAQLERETGLLASPAS